MKTAETAKAESRNSPEPWRLDADRWQVTAANGSLVCKIATGEDAGEELANGRLIEAAPQLRDALRECVQRMAALQENTNYPLAWPRVKALAALAACGGAQ